ncbi:hypothetical protein CK203_029976 [Vitis vinifera]|uniref:Uncharacterized protein n=1 Tax=Vitis vinifera TaxID=29760 RepID=A0A438IKA1_VITVI|nr:hypothetical protein CK203_029976 [Vitis vinifera]
MGNMIVCQGCKRHDAISLIPGHGAPLSQHHYTEVDLMLFNCNGGWLAIFHFYPF